MTVAGTPGLMGRTGTVDMVVNGERVSVPFVQTDIGAPSKFNESTPFHLDLPVSGDLKVSPEGINFDPTPNPEFIGMLNDRTQAFIADRGINRPGAQEQFQTAMERTTAPEQQNAQMLADRNIATAGFNPTVGPSNANLLAVAQNLPSPGELLADLPRLTDHGLDPWEDLVCSPQRSP